MKQYADRQQTKRVFSVGDKVYLKLWPAQLKQISPRSSTKLSPKFYKPYEVLARVGQVAYRLCLPAGSLIHPVFHVSLLKPSSGHHTVSSNLPIVVPDDQQRTEPIAILDKRVIYKHQAPLTEVLIKWANMHPENSTWEYLPNLLKQFPRVASLL